MRFLRLLCFLISSSLAAKTTITAQIYEIDYGTKNNDDTLLFLSTGKVGKIGLYDREKLFFLNKVDIKNKWFIITMDGDRFITKITETDPVYLPFNESFFEERELKNYTYIPTTVENMKVAHKYHRNGRRTHKEETQCFNRAMIWSYEWWKNHSLRSMKIFIFFSRNYIRRYDFEWWFHVAPYIHVMDDGKVVERVMDLKYTNRPLNFRNWTDIFMKNNAECNVITKYSEYADYPYSGECFLQRTNMYTYQPADLQMFEAWNYRKDKFIYNEVKGAYLEAFDINFQ